MTTTTDLNEQHALQAWKKAISDAFCAVKYLRDSSGLGLREAVELIHKTAAKVGVRCSLRVRSFDELPPELAEALSFTREEDAARQASHRAARGVKKVRGAK